MGRLPAELEDAMTIDEWAEFAALAVVDPWTEDREDLRAAIVAAAARSTADGRFEPAKFIFSELYAQAREAELAAAAAGDAGETVADRQRRVLVGLAAVLPKMDSKDPRRNGYRSQKPGRRP